MSRLQKLLLVLFWEMINSSQKMNLEEQRLHELETGILKVYIAFELLQKAFMHRDFKALRKKLLYALLKSVQKKNIISRISFLEEKIDQILQYLQDTGINSKNLQVFCEYLEGLKSGNITPPEACIKLLTGGMPIEK